MTEFDSVIPAGHSGTLTAKIKTTTTQSGPVSKSIAVTTNAAGAQRMTLSVTFYRSFRDHGAPATADLNSTASSATNRRQP